MHRCLHSSSSYFEALSDEPVTELGADGYALADGGERPWVDHVFRVRRSTNEGEASRVQQIRGDPVRRGNELLE